MTSTKPNDIPQNQWADPVMANDRRPIANSDTTAPELLRAAHVPGTESLYILGIGFDPRCCTGLLRYIEAVGANPQVLAIDLRDPGAPKNYGLDGHRSANADLLESMAAPGKLHVLEYPQVHEQAGVGRAIARLIDASGFLKGRRNIVVDLSALPTVVSFPVLKLLLDKAQEDSDSPNLEVVVVENPALDARINDRGVAEAAALPGFNSGTLARSRPAGQVRVWTPVIGERSGPALEKISNILQPDEVCPILPYPATDARRADRLVLEHRELLVDRYEVGSDSFIYADEGNPFDLATSLVRFYDDYRQTLEPLQVAPVVCASSHSSKLLSVGVLLAAYQRKIPVMATRTTSYELDESVYEAVSGSEGHLAVLWLRGDPYRD